MAGKKTGKRLLTWVLVLVMALSLLPLNALAAGGPETDGGSGMNFDKRLVDDEPDGEGNYTIRMTAQATGTTTTKVEPMDIVLVLDQSGSMADDFSNGTRQSAMIAAVNSFIGEVANKYSTDADHRMAIVTFGYDAAKLVGWTAVDPAGATELTRSISNLPPKPEGATNVGAGMQMAKNLMNDAYTGNNTDRQKTVIVFTDGVPTTKQEFNTTVADAAIDAAKSMKNSGVTIYTVGIFNGANPTEMYGASGFDTDSDGTVNSEWAEDNWGLFPSTDFPKADRPAGNRFLNLVSSNYPNADSIGLKRETSGLGILYSGISYKITKNFNRVAEGDYYLTASDASSLEKIFKDISTMVPEPDNAELNGDTVITDTLSDYFTFALTEDGKVDVKVYAEKGNEKTDITDKVTVNPNPQTKTVTVTDYDFSKHHTESDDPEELVIEIKVKPSGDGCTSKEIPTNDDDSIHAARVEVEVESEGETKTKIVTSHETAKVTGHQVIYNLDGGTGNITGNGLYYPQGAAVPVTNSVPTLEGYEFTGWKSDIEGDNTVYTSDGDNRSITMPAADVTLTAQWKLIEAADLSVEKTVTRINGSTPTTDANGNITTIAYPGDEIEWTITVANSGNATGNFTLNETLSGITVKDTAGNPVALSNNEWRDTVAAGQSVSYTVTYTVQPADVTDNGLVNTVTMNGTSEESAPVPTAQKYTVTYEYTGTIPTDAPAVPVAAQHEYGAEVTIENVPTLTGYTFHGWTLPEGLTANDGKFNMPAKNVTITGYWTKNTIPTYTFDLSNLDTIKVNKEFKSMYGRSATRSFTATVTIERKETYTAVVDPGSPILPNVTNNRSAATAEPTYTPVGKPAIGTVTLRTDTTDVFKFDKTFKLEPGTYHITVKETEGPDRYVVDYDTNTYTYEFIVDNEGKINIDTPITCTFTNKYTKRHSAATPSKPTLNTGDHYAYVMGYPDGTVRPNGSITRAEVSAILFRLLSDKTRDEYFTTESSFTDVKAGAWYNNSIATLEKAGVIVDTAKGGAFRPNEAITRAELAAMLAQFSDAKPVKGVKFSDVPAEHWAYEAIAIAAKMGWIEGYPDGTFRPDATITRAEMMTLVNRALDRVPSDEDHLLSKRVMLTFPDCKSGDWFYIAVQEATNSHTYERAATEKNGDEQWTALRANRDWTLLEK